MSTDSYLVSFESNTLIDEFTIRLFSKSSSDFVALLIISHIVCCLCAYISFACSCLVLFVIVTFNSFFSRVFIDFVLVYEGLGRKFRKQVRAPVKDRLEE